MKDYDNHDTEDAWCNEQHIIVKDYLQSLGLNNGRIGEWPAWHIAPYVSVWAIESNAQPESIGWWVISGDLPTDYISASDCSPPQHPRKAIRAFAERWIKVIDAWQNGREYENFTIGGCQDSCRLYTSSRDQSEALRNNLFRVKVNVFFVFHILTRPTPALGVFFLLALIKEGSLL